MLKLYLISFLFFFTSCGLMNPGESVIYSYAHNKTNEIDYINAMNIFWERYPAIRLDSTDRKKIAQICPDLYKQYLFNCGDSVSYFKNDKALYPYFRKTEYTTINTFMFKSFDKNFFYEVRISNCLTGCCTLSLIWAYNINKQEYVSGHPRHSKEGQQIVSKQFSLEIISKIESIINEKSKD